MFDYTKTKMQAVTVAHILLQPRGPQVNYILDEIVMAGMVLETNADLILEAVKDAATGKTLKNPS